MKVRSIPFSVLRLGMLLGSFSSLVHAQATQSAEQRIRLTGYGLISYVRPEYNHDSSNPGGTIGGDIDGFRLLPHTDIGLDVRYTLSNGSDVKEHLFQGGPRVSFNAYRFRPYAAFLIGVGRADFNTILDPAYLSDRTRTKGYAAGFDYRVTRYWSVRADAQRQRWRFSVRVSPFYPVEVSMGVAYQVHFHSRKGPQ